MAALLAAAAAALIVHSLLWNFVTDDAFISFVYSRNLARHGALVFNLGERVEGYTNFLWTVLLAGLLKVGLAPEVMSRVLGTAAACGTLVVCASASRRLRGADAEWSAWDAAPALFLATVPGFACWASGGLETQLFTFLVTLGSLRYLADAPPWQSAAAFGLAALTRPEGLLFFALTALHRAAANLRQRRLWPTRAEWLGVATFAALVVPHLLWRRWYYGWWLPNTFYIKSSGGGAAVAWAQGGYYLRRFVEQFHLWVVPLVTAVALVRRRERPLGRLAGYVAWVAAVFLIYVASVGGDFMGLFRFAMPIVPIAVLLAVCAVRSAIGDLRPGAQVAAVALLFAGHVAHAAAVDRASLVVGADAGPAGNIDSPGYLRWYTADRAAIGKWFGQYAQPDDYAAVGGAGAQVYYSGMRSLDCFGLSDEYIAHRVPARSSRPGHQKYAPDEYILSKRPTIITSANYRIGPAPYRAPDEALWRARGYHYVNVQVPGLSSPWYSFLLRDDRALGPLPRLTDEEP
jgi:hypothetical protein